MTTENNQQFDCLLLQQEQDYLLLPAVSVIETLPQKKLNIVIDLQGAVLGKIQWRNKTIPLLSFDSACHNTMPKLDSQTKAAIVYSLSDESNLRHFAFTVKGDPEKVIVSPNNIKDLPIGETEYFVSSKNLLNDEKQVYIPDLPALAEYIDRQLLH